MCPQGASSERSGEGKEDAEAEKGHDEEGKSKQEKGARGKPSQDRPGRAEGAPGYSRTQQLRVDKECVHRPERCCACGHR